MIFENLVLVMGIGLNWYRIGFSDEFLCQKHHIIILVSWLVTHYLR